MSLCFCHEALLFFSSSVYPSEKWLLVVDALVKWQADASAIRRMMG